MIQVTFEQMDKLTHRESDLKFVVIASQHKDKWVFVQHKARQTWEMPGGHIEENESADDAAKRELHEETGAIEFDLYPVIDYNVISPDAPGDHSWGRLYWADIVTFAELPDLEIGKVCVADSCPGEWTYAAIQPQLQGAIENWLEERRKKNLLV